MKTLFLALFAALACQPQEPARPPPVQPPDDTTVITPIPEEDVCAEARSRLVALGCPPTDPRGGTWIAACRDARALGNSFGATCITRATSCAQADEC